MVLQREAHLLSADCLEELGRPIEAIAATQAALAMCGTEALEESMRPDACSLAGSSGFLAMARHCSNFPCWWDALTRWLGPEHLATLTSRSNLANALSSQGRFAEAEEENRAVLAVRERVLGPEHPNTLTSRNNLAAVLRSQGRFAEAEEENRAVLAVQERVLGPEHPDTLISRSNLTRVLLCQGRFAEAEEEHRAVLAVQERVLGPEHPDTLISRSHLANALHSQGRFRGGGGGAPRGAGGPGARAGAGTSDAR